MKIVQILGGLGNQMFQYAFLVALRETFGGDVLMDISQYDTYPLHNGFELDAIFKITAGKANDKDVHHLYWPFFTHSYRISKVYRKILPPLKTECREDRNCVFNPKILENYKDKYYVGYWQNHKYFDKYRQTVLKEFEYRTPLDGKNLEFSKQLGHKIICSIHVRRGDFMNSDTYRNLCGLDYYVRAINFVIEKKKNVVFAIFSNDFAWCKNNIYPLLGDREIIEANWNRGKNSYNDMRLMSMCKYNIIANSTFSWWAAYLNENPNKLIVSPEKWLNLDWRFRYPLDEWITF